ncbi:MAG: winged helix-turn-helix domain-containing protein [Gammaproteobacteria bacterium]|nr:winged helix-turn-helix domain-containing protein [Gammaproteobacteria bacterium]
MSDNERTSAYQFGDWVIEPHLNQLRREQTRTQLQPRTMDVLRYLLEHAGEIVSLDDLLDNVWKDRVVEQNVIHRNITRIRHALGDDPRNPEYIETVSKRGYRAIAPVGKIAAEVPQDPDPPDTIEVAPPRRIGTRQHWPAYALLALIAVVVGMWYWQETGVHTPPLSEIAVMPLDDLSERGDHAWLGAGLAEELIESLSRIDALGVRGRSSTTNLKTQEADITAVGARLGVGSVVDGSVRRAGEQLVIVVQWIRVEDESRLWTARYEGAVEEIFEIQRDIAVGVAEAIRTELGIRDTFEDLMKSRYETSNVRAYEYLRRGLEIANTLGTDGYAEWGDLILQAIEIDPEYAEAHGQYAIYLFAGGDLERAGEVARHALSLDPDIPSAHFVLANESLRSWQFEAAEERLQRSLAATPHGNSGLYPYLELLQATGRIDEAVDMAHRLVKVEGAYPQAHAALGEVLLNVGDYQAALAAFEQALALGPVGPGMHIAMAYLYHLDRRDADALEAMLRAWPDYEGEIRSGFEAAGWQGLNLALAEVMPVNVCPAWHYAMAGEKELMYECLEINLIDTYRFLPELLNASPALAAFRDEPRFRSLVARMNERIARGVFGVF